jgi:hypothetical protein
MQFDLVSFLIFVAFILPGVVAQTARDSLTPRSLKSRSLAVEIGELIIAGLWVHVLLLGTFRLVLEIIAPQYLHGLLNNLRYSSMENFLWNHSTAVGSYFLGSLALGYIIGAFQGWLIYTQPFRKWLTRPGGRMAAVLEKLGIPGFLQEQPVWYFAFRQKTTSTQVFVEVEMKDGAGFYTGELITYAILDDSVRSKDFCLVNVNFKPDRTAEYSPLKCDALLLNFEDVRTLQLVKIDPEQEGEEEQSQAEGATS